MKKTSALIDFSLVRFSVINEVYLRFDLGFVCFSMSQEFTVNQHSLKLVSCVRILESLHERISRLELGALKANLGKIHVDGVQYKKIDQGDDGYIILALDDSDSTKKYIMKIFRTKEVSKEDQPAMDALVADQAKRELTALTLLKGHPNVAKLISTEIDTCGLHMDGLEYPGSLMIRQEYIPDLVKISSFDWSVLSIVREGCGKDSSFHIDFKARNRLIRYVLGQIASVVKALKENGIYHRDCNFFNVMIQKSRLHFYLLDFARADLPGVAKADDLMKEPASEVMMRIKKTRYENLNYLAKSDFESIFRRTKMCILEACYSSLYDDNEDEEDVVRNIFDEAERDFDQLIPFAEPPKKELDQYEDVWNAYQVSKTFFKGKLTEPVHSDEVITMQAAKKRRTP